MIGSLCPKRLYRTWMIYVYNSPKDAVSGTSGIPKCYLKKAKVFGLFNEGIYYFKNKAYKVSYSRKEAKACKRLIGKKFNNVCNIYNIYPINVLCDDKEKYWDGFVIEQEKLYRDKRIKFNHLTMDYVVDNVSLRAPLFIDIANGLIELNSVGIKYNDLHSLNVMRDVNGNIKIIDFDSVTFKRN